MIDTLPVLAAAPPSGGNPLLELVLPFALMALVMYFLLIRPQQQQRKKHQEMLSNLKKNDMVITSGGLIGKIVKIDEREVKLNLGDSEVRVLRSMIVDLHNKDAAPAKSTKKEG